jgi:hypothetical protein
MNTLKSLTVVNDTPKSAVVTYLVNTSTQKIVLTPKTETLAPKTQVTSSSGELIFVPTSSSSSSYRFTVEIGGNTYVITREALEGAKATKQPMVTEMGNGSFAYGMAFNDSSNTLTLSSLGPCEVTNNAGDDVQNLLQSDGLLVGDVKLPTTPPTTPPDNASTAKLGRAWSEQRRKQFRVNDDLCNAMANRPPPECYDTVYFREGYFYDNTLARLSNTISGQTYTLYGQGSSRDGKSVLLAVRYDPVQDKTIFSLTNGPTASSTAALAIMGETTASASASSAADITIAGIVALYLIFLVLLAILAVVVVKAFKK